MSDQEDVHQEESKERTEAQEMSRYNPRKPKWWKQKSRKATKSQRRTIAECTSHQLSRPPYGTFFDFEQIFSNNKRIWFEIGFGSGDNLLYLAQETPDVCFVGAEIHSAGVGTILQRIQRVLEKRQKWQGCKLVSDTNDARPEWTEQDANGNYDLDNLRICGQDGVKLLPYFPVDSLDAVLITFPDPFPKKDEEQWRIVQIETVRKIRAILKPSGRLLLATDHPVFYEWAIKTVEQYNERYPDALIRLVEPCPDRSGWLPVVSRYEQKGLDEGRHTMLACWEAL